MTNFKWNAQDIILVFVINMVMSFIVGKLFVKPGLEFVMDPLLAGILNGVFLAVSFTASIYFFLIKNHPYTWEDLGFRKSMNKRRDSLLVFMYTGIALISAILILSFMYLVVGVSPNERGDSLENPHWIGIILSLLSAVLISPIYEEIFYRGVLYQAFRSWWGVRAGVIVSSLFFTLAHLPSLDILPVNAVTGFLLALIYEKTHSIYIPMIVHGLFNLGIFLIGFILM